MTPIAIILAVSQIGGRLGIAGDNLKMLLPADCPPELKTAIRDNKPALMGLLKLHWFLVESKTLQQTLFWASDEATKQHLIDAGAETGSIYTGDELRLLANRRVTSNELSAIHAARKRFEGRIQQR